MSAQYDLPHRRGIPKLWTLKLLQVLTGLLLPSGIKRKRLSIFLCKQTFSQGRKENSITKNVNFVSWRDKKGFIILCKETDVSGERRKKIPYIYHLQNTKVRWHCGERKESFSIIMACKFLLLRASSPGRNTKKSREDCLTKTPIFLIVEIFKSEDTWFVFHLESHIS